MNELTKREQSLVALGAAIASNCVPCVEYHIPVARRVGLSDTEIDEALGIADKVRQVPARAVLEAALARIETSPECPAEKPGKECGCAGPAPARDLGGVS
jgi:4-carboxymuconolactone decarboxylase